MTTIQQKAIRQAIKLLEETEARAFYPINYKDADAMAEAAKKQNTDVWSDAGKIRDASEWLKAALG